MSRLCNRFYNISDWFEQLETGNFVIIQELLLKRQDVNHETAYGETALILASWKGHENIIWLLLDNDADVNHQNNNGWSVLMFVSQYGYDNIVRLLLDYDADVNHKNKNGNTALSRNE